jgi:hypothetical protein
VRGSLQIRGRTSDAITNINQRLSTGIMHQDSLSFARNSQLSTSDVYHMNRILYLPLFLLLTFLSPTRADDKPAIQFHVKFDKGVLDQPLNGRVLVVLLRQDISGVVRQLNWFKPEPSFARDVKSWKPGEEVVVGAGDIICLPEGRLPSGRYFVQAILDRDLGSILGPVPGISIRRQFLWNGTPNQLSRST